MMKSKIAVLIIIAFAMVNVAFANIKIDGKSLEDKLPIDPKVKIGKLDNGLTYYIRENGKPENRAEMQILIKAGSIQETDAQAGLAHFTEHMCFNGTKNFPKDSLVSFLEATGMRFGADVNANTGFVRTYYMLTIPMDKPELLDQGFQVLEDWLHNVSFDEEEIEKERGVIMEEWRLYRGANERVQREHFPKLLYGSKYAERLPIGDTAVIKNAPREEFLRYYNTWYRPNISAVIVVGDFDAAKMEKKIKAHFADVKNPKDAPELVDYEIKTNEKPLVSIATDKELTYPMVQIYFKQDKKDNAGTYEAYLTGIKNRLFSTMLSERLNEKTREAEPPYLFAQAALTSFIANKDAFMMIGVPKGDILNTTEILLDEAYRVKQHGFTEPELQRAKDQLMAFIESAHAEKDKTESVAYAMEYYRHFIEEEGMPGIDYELKLYQEFIPQITLEDVNSMIDGLIRQKDLVITVSDKEGEGTNTPNEEQLLALFETVKNKELEPYTEADLSKPLLAEIPAPGEIVSEESMDDIGMKKIELSNGVKVLMKKTDFKNDEVLMRAYSPGGNSLASKDNYITAANAASIISECGVGDFSATNLDKKLAGKVLRVSPYIGELTEGFSGMTSPDDMETFFQLIYLYFTSPRMDFESFESYVNKTVESIKNAQSDPNNAFRDTINAVLGNYHYRSMPLTIEQAQNMDIKEAFNFYNDRFGDASDFTFIFVGNYDEAKLKEFAKTYLASLPAKDRNESWKDVGRRYPKGKIQKIVKKGIEYKSSIRIAIPGDFDYTPENRFKLNAMTEVLNIRLREVIREDKGGVYGIGSRGFPSKYPYGDYVIQVFFGTNPDRVEELTNTVYEVMDEVMNGEFDNSYVDKVKEILSREYETNLKENRFWLNSLYTKTYYGEPCSSILKYDEKVDEINKEMIVEAAKKYLDRTNLVEVFLYPEEN
jgi:zinc protease